MTHSHDLHRIEHALFNGATLCVGGTHFISFSEQPIVANMDDSGKLQYALQSGIYIEKNGELHPYTLSDADIVSCIAQLDEQEVM